MMIFKCGQIYIYKIDRGGTKTILGPAGTLRAPAGKPLLEIVQKQKQIGSHDCGLFAIATAIAILFGHDAASIHFSQRTMRNHLTKCFEEQSLTPFPQEIM